MLSRSEADRADRAARVRLPLFLQACGWLVCAGLVACNADVKPAPAAPTPPLATAAPAPPGGAGTSVPDAAATFVGQDIADRAKAAAIGASAAANTPTVSDQANSRTPNTMSKEQESKAMPLPGQANDHSTPTRDKKLVK